MPAHHKPCKQLLPWFLFLLFAAPVSKATEPMSDEEVFKYMPKSYNIDKGNLQLARVMELGEAAYPSFCNRLLSMDVHKDPAAIEFANILIGLAESKGDKTLPLETIRQLAAIHSGNSKIEKTLRWHIVQALGKIGDPQDVAYLLNLLKDPDYLIQATSVRALGQLGGRDVLPALQQWEEMQGKLDPNASRIAQEAIQLITQRVESKPARLAPPNRAAPLAPPTYIPLWLWSLGILGVGAALWLLFRKGGPRASH